MKLTAPHWQLASMASVFFFPSFRACSCSIQCVRHVLYALGEERTETMFGRLISEECFGYMLDFNGQHPSSGSRIYWYDRVSTAFSGKQSLQSDALGLVQRRRRSSNEQGRFKREKKGDGRTPQAADPSKRAMALNMRAQS